MPRHLNTSQALTTVSDEDWALAREREPIVRDLVQNPPAYGARAEAMAAAASELRLTPNHLYRLLKAYEADPRTRSLLLKPPGPAGGGKRLDDRVEGIIEEEIKTSYLTLLHPKKSLLMKGIHARCAAEGLTKPARQTVDTRLAAISKREQTKRRHGRKRARDAFDPIQGSLEAERALEIVQIDHTPVDLMAVEPNSLEVIGRPFITLAVDIRTRMYGGFYLTFDPPSATSVAACIAHAVMDKLPGVKRRTGMTGSSTPAASVHASGIICRWPSSPSTTRSVPTSRRSRRMTRTTRPSHGWCGAVTRIHWT